MNFNVLFFAFTVAFLFAIFTKLRDIEQILREKEGKEEKELSKKNWLPLIFSILIFVCILLYLLWKNYNG